MAIRQVTVPYLRGYDFGIGADLSSGSPMGLSVEGAVTPVRDSPGAKVNIEIQRVHSTGELETALGIDVDASYGCAAFGAGVSARFNFAKKSKVQTNSLFMCITVNVELAFLQIDDPVLTSPAAEIVNRSDLFASRYGNMFVRGIGRGGLFVGVLRIDTGSSDESQDISGELEGSYGLFSASAKTKLESIQKKYRSEVFVQMYHEGGPVDLRIEDLTNPLELLDNANRFLESFRTSPDTVAIPYFVTLAPIQVARGPLPPNAAQLQTAQDIIVFCAKRRSVLLDQINLLDFIRQNSSKFDFTKGPDTGSIIKATRDAEEDFQLIADCAGAAMNSPEEAKMPAEFAKARGEAFPKLVMPDPMPAPRGAKIVLVPDFGNCKSFLECTSLAANNGLHSQQVQAAVTPGDFKVLSVSPPVGTAVSEGSIVTITTCPLKQDNGPLVSRDGGTRRRITI